MTGHQRYTPRRPCLHRRRDTKGRVSQSPSLGLRVTSCFVIRSDFQPGGLQPPGEPTQSFPIRFDCAPPYWPSASLACPAPCAARPAGMADGEGPGAAAAAAEPALRRQRRRRTFDTGDGEGPQLQVPAVWDLRVLPLGHFEARNAQLSRIYIC